MRPFKSQSIAVPSIALLLAASALLPVLSAHPLAPTKKTAANRPQSGEEIFKQNCSSCHPGGGNVAKPDKPVANSVKLNSIDVLKTYLNGKHKPVFKQIVVSPKMLESLYQFCKGLQNQQAREAYNAKTAGSMN